jgi:Flp pilus assembly protein TadG
MTLDHSVRQFVLSSTFHRLKAAMLFRALKLLLRADGGAALVEGALILPVFLLLVGGVYEFGFFLYQEQLVTSGVEDAARYLALSADPTGVGIQTDAKNLAVTGSINGGPPRVRGWSMSDVAVTVDTVDNSTGTYSGGSTIQVVTVSTSFLDPTLGFLNLLHLNPPTISVSHQERVVGGSAPAQG